MNSVILTFITGLMGHGISAMLPMPPTHIPDTNGPLLSEPLIIALAVFILVIILIPTISVTRKMQFRRNLSKRINDFEPTVYHEPTFEEKLKKAKLNPQKVIAFGQNRFAADGMKKKLFVRSSKAIDGVLLSYEDIVSYEIIKDGKVIARPGSGLIDNRPEADEDGIICSDLRLVIKTKESSNPEVVMPFIAFSIDSEFA